jgi:DNA-binding response OmpR family regulator
MTDARLQNCRILVVEDDYFLASELVEFLSETGAVVIGPASSIQDALALIDESHFLKEQFSISTYAVVRFCRSPMS